MHRVSGELANDVPQQPLRNRFRRYRWISATSVCCGREISSDQKG
jgi:hypothetical protein